MFCMHAIAEAFKHQIKSLDIPNVVSEIGYLVIGL